METFTDVRACSVEMLGYRNPPKTTHNMVGKQVKLYLIKNKKKK